ncbi:MAG: DNA polymerase III subunit gamma/tau [Chlorogloeopsis fritschii C42_A2020_084]|uniref:DNA polymerase III subunit gamma/tau n=1 Tax=Chlorogloeopsis fritschii TaxID=1124 RepID=UPI0019E21A15|nr:DNA polymerase III subunit gamma/tau [Chlorogloeopsis fritschii]MBF2004261.1 DNA polymerase III subunit gamma/tau [Chlorogloeopsis fritschii C42_A2020_084]
MSYEPLHHKYRPKSFAELVGQEAIATTLTNAIRAAKIAPAYLFTGPRGTGKTSSARILAKSLNCIKSDKPTSEPCGVCDVCQGITKGYSLDVIEIDAASNTGVDNIREIIERAQFAPVQCRYKVYVVDECHMLSTAAFNALLKTLEEPPKHVVFVLATTDPQRVLPTIISRCQRFDFRRIPLEAMVKHLSNIATQENINITPEAVTLIAQIAQGGLRDAESLLDQLSLLSGEVTPERVWDLVGSVSERDLLILLSAIASDNPEVVLDCTRKILDRGREPLIILQNLASFYRDLLIANTAPNRHDLVACTPQTWQALVDLSQQLDRSTILLGQQHLRSAEVQLKNTTQPRLWLEVTLLGLLPSAHHSSQPSTTSRPTPAATPNLRISTPPPSFAPSPSNKEDAHRQYTSEHEQTSEVVNGRQFKSSAADAKPVSENGHIAANPTFQAANGSASKSQMPSPETSASNLPTTKAYPTEREPPEETQSPAKPPAQQSSGQNNGSSKALSHDSASGEFSPPGNDSSTNQEQVATTANFDLTQIWQQVLANFQPVSRRELLRQMCHLIEFDGAVACIAIKQAWYKKVQSEQSKIAAAFQETFQRQIQVNLALATASNSTLPKSTSSPQPQPTFNQQRHNPPVETAKAVQTPPQKTESVKNPNVVKTSPPPQPQTAPTVDWETDEVAIAAQRLAQFFDGQIINFTEDTAEVANSNNTAQWEEEAETDEEF